MKLHSTGKLLSTCLLLVSFSVSGCTTKSIYDLHPDKNDPYYQEKASAKVQYYQLEDDGAYNGFQMYGDVFEQTTDLKCYIRQYIDNTSSICKISQGVFTGVAFDTDENNRITRMEFSATFEDKSGCDIATYEIIKKIRGKYTNNIVEEYEHIDPTTLLINLPETKEQFINQYASSLWRQEFLLSSGIYKPFRSGKISHYLAMITIFHRSPEHLAVVYTSHEAQKRRSKIVNEKLKKVRSKTEATLKSL